MENNNDQLIKDTTTLNRWAEQVGRLASTFSDERALLCQQAAVLLHRIAFVPAASNVEANALSVSTDAVDIAARIFDFKSHKQTEDSKTKWRLFASEVLAATEPEVATEVDDVGHLKRELRKANTLHFNYAYEVACIARQEPAICNFPETDDVRALIDGLFGQLLAPDKYSNADLDVAKDAARWKFRRQLLGSGGAILFGMFGCQLRRVGELISHGASEEEAIDAALRAERKAESSNEQCSHAAGMAVPEGGATLTPCPFCKSSAAPRVGTNVDLGVNENTEFFGYTVYCDASPSSGGCGANCGFHDTDEQAREQWGLAAL